METVHDETPFALIAVLLLAAPMPATAVDCKQLREDMKEYPTLFFLGYNGDRQKAYFVAKELVERGGPIVEAAVLLTARKCGARVLLWEDWDVGGNLELGEDPPPRGVAMIKINLVYFTDGMSCMVTPMADFVEALKGQGWQRIPMERETHWVPPSTVPDPFTRLWEALGIGAHHGHQAGREGWHDHMEPCQAGNHHHPAPVGLGALHVVMAAWEVPVGET